MLKLNSLADIYSAYSIAWSDTVDAIDGAMTEAIEDERYTWPRGESPRDIVDTHALADSQHVDKIGSVARFSWGDSEVDYAIDVHEGEGSKPARRWTREAIRGDDTASLQWQNPKAILNVSAHFTDRFRANYRG